MPQWLVDFAPILILLVVVAIVIARLPKIEGVEHSKAFRRRRLMNWLPLGLTYGFLYMGRYNLTVAKSAFGEMPDSLGNPLMGNDGFNLVFGVGTVVYGIAFLINGPLTDRFGGKKAILLGAAGSTAANLAMGLCSWVLLYGEAGPKATVADNFAAIFTALYAVNMYFQSFGAVAIVKVNAPWFHLRERGVFGAIFGILISLGIYFAFDWGRAIKTGLGLEWVFLVPVILLTIFLLLDIFLVRNTPGEAGFEDFDTADASSDSAERLPVIDVFKMMFNNKVIVTIACIEFCSGFLRQAIMQWYMAFAKQTDATLGLKESFVNENWGLMLCCAGIMGGVFAGTLSDHLFQSRRGPVAGILYLTMFISAIVLTFVYDTQIVGWLVVFMSMCVIGVHGMLSGTASMDFGGKQNVGVAVGIIDGMVYLGTGTMALTYYILLPKQELDAAGNIVGAATDPDNWISWPAAMIPVAFVGFLLCLKVWNAKPTKAGAAH